MSEKLPYIHGRLVVECMPRQLTTLCLTSDRHAHGGGGTEKKGKRKMDFKEKRKEREKWTLKRRLISSPDLVVPCD
jgi:hypothetical protein